MKYNHKVRISFIFAILFYIIMLSNHVSFAGTLSSDINGINESKYPGIKSQIQNLQKQYSNYKFQVYYTGIDWTEAVTMEYQGHGSSPKNLFYPKDNYKGKWYCPICGSKKYDTGWCCASVDAIKYMMDPRNSFDGASIYQFKNLETADVSSGNLQAVIKNKYGSYSYLNNSTAINAIVKASSNYKMNAYSILAKIINEQGKGSSVLVTGKGYNGQYVGYYNFFNVGAYGNGTSTVITNGLKYAKNKGWNSVEKSILGGSEYYKSQYIGRGQNTLYYQRFNVVYTTSLFSHQYQQDIMGAETSAGLLKSYYTASNTLSSVKHTFIIPLYENMPKTKCTRPSTTENHPQNFEEATVISSKLAVKASPNSSRIISYLNKNEKVRVLERASSKSSDGNYWDTIVSNIDGTYGYVLRSGITAAQPKISLPKYIFDSKYYADNNKDVKAAFGYDEQQLINHYINNGIREGRASSATFNVKYYLDSNSDLQKAFGSNNYQAAYNHFVNYGCKEYRKSSEEYDSIFYRYYYSDLTNLSSINLMENYLNTGKITGRMGGLDPTIEKILFDPNVYTSCHSDIKAAFGNNVEKLRKHWYQYGIAEGRKASILYDGEMYSRLNSDIGRAFGKNYKRLLEHFVKNGINEKRVTSLVFSMERYLSLHADIQKKYGTNYKKAYLHFIEYGIREGREASYVFDVKTYLSENKDLQRKHGTNYKSAFIHFMIYGVNEKRKTSTTFDMNYYAEKYDDLKKAYKTNYRKYFIHYLEYGINEKRKAI